MMRRGDTGGPPERGFTLVETMVAMILVGAVVLPASLWLYKSRTHRAAWEKFHAVQALEMRLHQAVLLGAPGPGTTEAGGLRITVEARDEGDGLLLRGIARDRRGKEVAALEALSPDRDGP